MNQEKIKAIHELCKEFDIKLYPNSSNVPIYLKPAEETSNIKPIFYIKQNLTLQ